jgi:hypothetical protein
VCRQKSQGCHHIEPIIRSSGFNRWTWPGAVNTHVARRKGLGTAAGLAALRYSALIGLPGGESALSLLSSLSTLFETLSSLVYLLLSLPPCLSPPVSLSLSLLLCLPLSSRRSLCSQGLQSSGFLSTDQTDPFLLRLASVLGCLLVCVWRRHFWRMQRSPPSPSWLLSRYNSGWGGLRAPFRVLMFV